MVKRVRSGITRVGWGRHGVGWGYHLAWSKRILLLSSISTVSPMLSVRADTRTVRLLRRAVLAIALISIASVLRLPIRCWRDGGRVGHVTFDHSRRAGVVDPAVVVTAGRSVVVEHDPGTPKVGSVECVTVCCPLAPTTLWDAS